MKIITVLKSGGDYTERHVKMLKEQIIKHAPGHEFVCLTDMEPNCKTIPLENSWPGWWSKMEIFKIEGPAIYFDLDTLILDNINEFLNQIQNHNFCIMRSWSDSYTIQKKPFTISDRVASGIMAWKGNQIDIYNTFAKRADYYMKRMRGDQDFIQDYLVHRILIEDGPTPKYQFFDQIKKQFIVSFKIDLNYGQRFDPKIHKIIVFHGKPRPWFQNQIDNGLSIKLKECQNFLRPENDPTFKATNIEAKVVLEKVIKICNQRQLCIQAGGNLGIFPYYLSQNFAHVITCEPVRETIKYLKRNLKSIKNVEIHECGLGAYPCMAELKQTDGNIGTNKMVLNQRGSIKIETIDNLINRKITQIPGSYNTDHALKCGLIYLDIEGGEYKALYGATKTIENHRPVLVIENNGLIEEYPADREGSQEFRDHICNAFNYKYRGRLMRDDIFIPC